MAAAAQTFIGTLDAAQKAKAQLPFDSEERFNWFYIPKDRVGLPLKQMTAPQRDAAMALLHAGLSEKGYTKAEAIRALEPVLAEIENNPVRRDPELYYVVDLRRPVSDGHVGLALRGPSSLAELDGGARPVDCEQPAVLRQQPGGGA